MPAAAVDVAPQAFAVAAKVYSQALISYGQY